MRALIITKVERGWYTFELHTPRISRAGHGSRRYVREAVDRALDEDQEILLMNASKTS